MHLEREQFFQDSSNVHCPVSWGCRICQLHLCRCITSLHLSLTSVLDMTQRHIMVRLQSWSTFSLPSLPDLLWPGVVVPVTVISMGQIELFNHVTVCKQIIESLILDSNTWNHLTVCKQIIKLNYKF